MEQLRDKINADRKVKKITIDAYLRNIRLLANATTGQDFDGNIHFLSDITAIKQELKLKPLSTQKTYLASISVVGGIAGLDKEVLTKYRMLLAATKDAYRENLAGRNKSQRESDNWVALKDLEKVLKRLGRDVRERNIGKKEQLNRKDFKVLQQFVIASLYLLDNEPRRNIYASMKIITEQKDIKEDGNYLFAIGKTQNILVNSKLNKVLNIWLRYNKSGNLLLDSLGKQMNANQLTKALNVIFEGTGAKISSSMLRKIWLSDTYGETLTKMEESAARMGHSTGTAALHYIKK